MKTNSRVPLSHVIPLLALTLSTTPAFSMGKSSEETRKLQQAGDTIKTNWATINNLRAELGMISETAPAISQEPTLEELDKIIAVQSQEIGELQAKEKQSLDNLQGTVKSNLETINRYCAYLNLPQEKAPDQLDTLNFNDLNRIVVQQAQEINRLQKEYDRTLTESQRVTSKPSDLITNQFIDPSKWQESRCRNLGDSVTDAQVDGRKTWAKTCLANQAAKIAAQADAYVRAHGGISDPTLQTQALNLTVEASIVAKEAGRPWSNDGNHRFYPSFGTTAIDGTPRNESGLVAPVSYDAQNGCNVSYRSSGNDSGPTSNKVNTDLFNDLHYELVALCVSGCFTPDQRVMFKDGFIPIGDAFSSKNMEIVTLAPSSTLEHPVLETTELEAYTVDIAPSWQDVVDIETLSGKKITVTLSHALLDSEGRMRQAADLKPGENLVQADGSPDTIIQISKRSYYGKVYNVHPKSTDLMKNIVVAEGLLSGSVYYQNAGVKDLNRDLFRLHLPNDLIQ